MEASAFGNVCRDAVVRDGPALGRIVVAAWRVAYAGLMPAQFLAGLDAETGAAHFERAIRAGQSTLVVEADGVVVGFSVYGRSRNADATSSTGELIAINLLPSHWRRGLGTLLLGETVQRLQHQGWDEAILWVVHDNARARRFYEVSGWRPDGAEKHDDTLTGTPLHEVRYRRPLLESERSDRGL